ncbi:hypothetical protein V2I71_12745 [Peribacillus frigoritolerans]|uniref:hypothetical protein n=1 Tax=Peribacillus frigoritolerans TaxID=450367 RepID=UPI002ED4A66A|nr:hypothetical protein V2I71_12745 [Peribacillus frigoritolerans]
MIATEIKEDEMYTFAFDLTLKRPGCAILQGVHGCNPGMASLFHNETFSLTKKQY